MNISHKLALEIESIYNIFQLIAAFLVILALYIFYIFKIRPNFLKKFYVKQGFIDYDLNESDFKKLNQQSKDALGHIRYLGKKYANMKGIIAKRGKRMLIYITDSELLRELSQLKHVVKFRFPLGQDFNPYSLVRMEGEKHKRMRKLISSVFHFDYVISNIEVTTQVAMRKFKEWEENGYIGNEYIDILREAGNFAGEVVSVLFFGMSNYGAKINGKRLTDLIGEILIKFNEMNRRILMNPLLYVVYKLGLTKEFKNAREDLKAYRKYIRDFVVKKKLELITNMSILNNKKSEESSSPSRDLLTLLLNQQMHAENDDDKLTDEEIMAQYAMFLNAGEDTTSHLITNCLYVLTQHPLYVKSIREEIKQHVVDEDHMKYDEISRLTFLQAMLKETLRLYPPAYALIGRVATIDFKFSEGIEIKKDTMITGYILANSWKEHNFTEPNKFNPERWIGNGEGNTLKDPFAYLPFWAGSRNCIGQHLAMLEARIFLIQILSKYDIELIKDYEFKMATKFLYEPHNPLRIKFTKVK